MVALESLLDLPGLGGDLERVEGALRGAVRSEDAFLTEVASHLLSAGGKRLRPALAVAVGRLGAAPDDASAVPDVSEDVIQGGASVELVHLGSLYHDDVIDDAKTRRNVESVNARWGNLVAILAGDFLLARASEIAASLGPEASTLLASTIGNLCEGEVAELRTVFDLSRSEEAYLAAIDGKTASLLAASCRIGALAAGLSRDAVDAVTAYGRAVGMTFQIVDDILDVVATDEQLGKPSGQDLATGVYTLPVIRALQTAVDDELKALLGRPLDGAEVERARQAVRSNGAVTSASAVARSYADRAATALEPLGDGPVVHALAGLGHALVDTLPA